MRKKTLYLALIVITVISFAMVAVQVNAQQAYPAKAVQLAPAGGPGSSTDMLARAIEQALTVEKMIDKPFSIINKPGAGGNIATAFLVEQKGNAHVIAINSNRVLLQPLLGTIEYGLKDMTPVARLTSEYPVLAVRADSKYKSAMEVLADIKKDPNSVVFGLTALVSNNQFNILLPAKQYGIDYTKIKAVALPQGGEINTQLLGGHIPIISTSLSEILPHVDAGKARILCVAADSRLERLPNVPTWKDLGIDVVLHAWLGIFGPPAMPKVAYDYWNKKFAAMVKTKSWKGMLKKFDLNDAFLSGDDFRKKLEQDNVTYTELLGAMGMLNKEKKK